MRNFSSNLSIGIIGLGYVGLPLALAFSKHFTAIGFDTNKSRIKLLNQGIDDTKEVSVAELKCTELTFTSDPEVLANCNIYIVTVPTPIDNHKKPDLSALADASRTVASLLSIGDVVIYESTVYPGVTEDYCVPILATTSNLEFNKDFFVGYSPERINPGDQSRKVSDIVKITSGSTPEIADWIDQLYRKIITAGTYKTSSIQIAEAAKIIENTQRDINIALINELAILFNHLNIDTKEVLQAAGTKWNFLGFQPGLVGGHCIGVDPYYLTYKAQEIGYHPEVILAGRRINDSMGAFVASQIVKLMVKNKINIVDSNILLLGLSFKENCPDIRNSKVVDVLLELESYHTNVEVYDPWVNSDNATQCYNITPVKAPKEEHYDAIVLCVAHECFKIMKKEDLFSYTKKQCVIYDIKSALPTEWVDGRL